MSVIKPKRPILRYHGGKWILAKWIISNFPKHKIYTEAFGGAGSVLLQKPISYAEVYNDLDNEVVNLFKVARDQGDKIKYMLKYTPFSRKEFELSYIKADESLEQARRTVVRSFMSFGSVGASGKKTGFRSNSNRSGTTPAHDWKNLSDAFENLIKRLQGVVIENRDYKEIMMQQDSLETLHYADPPYLLDTRYNKQNTECYRFEMSNQDHIDMCLFLRDIKGYVILSGYENDIYNDYLNDWVKVKKEAYADGAKKRTEVLWINKVQQKTNLFN